MTIQSDNRRSLPRQSGRKKATRASEVPSRIGRFLDWALGPPITAYDSQVTGVSCPCRAVLIIDASGSMTDEDWKPSRLDGAKEAAKEYCNRVAKEEPGALISIIAYGSTAKTMCRPTRSSRIDNLHDSIDDIEILGCTNINAGLKAAIRAISDEVMPCQVVLLSDGHNTEQSPVRTAACLREKSVVECIGIGGSPKDVDAKLMRQIASAYPDGKKRYRWIGSKEQLVQEYKKIAGRLMRP